MRLAIAPEHKEFFAKNHFIEFDGLFQDSVASSLQQKADHILLQRLHLSERQLELQTPLSLFMAGRDLWRSDVAIKKILHNKDLSGITASLSNTSILRLAYDQYIRTGTRTGSFFPHPLTLEQMSSFRPIVGGLILNLSDAPPPFEPTQILQPFPHKKGSGVFLSPSFPLTFSPLFEAPHQKFLLLVYCKEKTLYVLEKNDPHTHHLKKEGYVFGDLLKTHTHPILYRS